MLVQISAVVALGESTLGEAVAHGVPRDKVTIIPNAVNMDAVRPIRNDRKLREAGNIIYVGRIALQKRVIHCLRRSQNWLESVRVAYRGC